MNDAPPATLPALEESAPWESSHGFAAIPAQPPADPSTTPGTDQTSSRDLSSRDSLPRVARSGDGTEERVDLPVHRPLLPRVLSVIAVGAALSVGAFYARRSLVHNAAPSVSSEPVQALLPPPSDPTAPAAPAPLPPSPSPALIAISPPVTASATSVSVPDEPAPAHHHHSASPSREAAHGAVTPAVPASNVAPTPSATSTKPDCTKNYTVDSDGNKIFRPECFSPR